MAWRREQLACIRSTSKCRPMCPPVFRCRLLFRKETIPARCRFEWLNKKKQMEMNMRHFLPVTFVMLLATAPAALAQKWEVGLGGGGSFYTSQSFTNPAGNASGKLASGFIMSGWLGNNSGKTWGGELRYDFEKSDLKLSSGSTNVNFGALTQAVHYDA